MGSTTSANTFAFGSFAFASEVPPAAGFTSAAGFVGAGAGTGAGAGAGTVGLGVAAGGGVAAAGAGAAATTFALSASVHPVFTVVAGCFALNASAAGRVTPVCHR